MASKFQATLIDSVSGELLQLANPHVRESSVLILLLCMWALVMVLVYFVVRGRAPVGTDGQHYPYTAERRREQRT